MPTSNIPHLPYGLDCKTDLQSKQPYQLIIELLPLRDPETEWFTLRDIAPLFKITERQLRRYCEELWPHRKGEHKRLNFTDACSLIRRAWFAGRSPQTVEELRAMWTEKFAPNTIVVMRSKPSQMLDTETNSALVTA